MSRGKGRRSSEGDVYRAVAGAQKAGVSSGRVKISYPWGQTVEVAFGEQLGLPFDGSDNPWNAEVEKLSKT
jgi:hypothetical protein